MITADALVALRSPLFSYAFSLCHEHTLAEDLVSEAITDYLEDPSELDDDAGHDLRLGINKIWRRELRSRERLPSAILTERVSVTIHGHNYSNPPGRASYDSYLLLCRDCGDVAARCQCD